MHIEIEIVACIHDNGKHLLICACFIDTGTIIAYSQTSSGKTLTLMGGIDYAGIIPLAIVGVFIHIDSVCVSPCVTFSDNKIYNEVIVKVRMDVFSVRMIIPPTLLVDVFVV